MASLQTDRTVLLITGICTAGLGLVGLLVWAGAPSDDTPHPQSESRVDDTRRVPNRAPDQPPRPTGARSPNAPSPPATPPSDEPSAQTRNPGAQAPTPESQSPNTDSTRPTASATSRHAPDPAPKRARPTTDTGTQSNPNDAGGQNRGYRDPVNQRVLGPRSWLAQPDDATARRVDRELKKDVDNPTRYDVADEDRARALNQMHAVAEQCAARHLSQKIRGHVIVRATLVVSNSKAQLQNVRLDDILRLENDRFQSCVTRRAADITFPGQRDGTLPIATGYKHNAP